MQESEGETEWDGGDVGAGAVTSDYNIQWDATAADDDGWEALLDCISGDEAVVPNSQTPKVPLFMLQALYKTGFNMRMLTFFQTVLLRCSISVR